MVAGGQLANLGLMENLIKECAEDANLPRTLTQSCQPVGTVQYCFGTEMELKPDTLFCYDLAVPQEIEPHSQDGEIADFQLMSVQDAPEFIRTGNAFKFDMSLVVLDFTIRQGILSPDSEADYEAILGRLHADSPAHKATQGISVS